MINRSFLLGFAALCPSVLMAGSFSQNFEGLATNTPSVAINVVGNINGTNATGGTVISNKKDTNNLGTVNVGVIKTGVGTGATTALRLAEKVTSSALGAMIVPVLDTGTAPLGEFTVELDLLLDKTVGATPADGFNISFGAALSGVGGAAGHPTAYGLVVNFDNYQNLPPADPRSIEIFSDLVSVGNFLATDLPGANFTYDQTFRHIILHWDANGLDLTYGGQVIFNNLTTPGFVPLASGNFAFNAATGGSMEDAYIDNIVITTTPPPVVVTSTVVIEEIMTDNASGLEDEDLDQPDWIDLYNGTATAASLTGWKLRYTSAPLTLPEITPPPATYTLPTLSIPAYSHQIVFASAKNKFTNVRPHTNFSLNKEGGTLELLAADGITVVHSLSYGPQKEDVSFGGLGDAQTVGFMDIATPGKNNSGLQATNFRMPAPNFFKPGVTPVIDQPSAVISATTSLGMALPPSAPVGSEIRYTLNTAEPSTASTLYTGPISITTGTAVKAKVFAPGWLPSKTGNRSFIWLSSGTDTSSTALINVATNYNGSGQPFSSSLPVIVMDSYLRNVDSATNAAGLRPYRFTQAAVYDVNPATGRASFGGAPTQVLRSGTHVRGQSSSGQPERPYALEFWKEDEDADRDEPLLGMPAHSDWVLMTLTLDKSLMRNYIMQQAMLDANGPGAGVRCRYVEVFFNQGNNTLDYADYRGVYLLMEKVSRSKERTNLAKLNDSMSDPSLINGGFIFKNDKTPYEYKINATSNAAIPGSSRDYDIYDPEPPTTAQAAALVSYLNQMTTALASATYNDPASANYYGKWLDERSFIDKTLWYELCKEVDAYVFSYYFSKDRNGRMSAFPFWDVDRSLGNSNYGSSNATFGLKWWVVGSNYTYYTRLDDDAEYNDRYWNRWTALRRSIFAKSTLFNRIEGVYSALTENNPANITNTASAATMALQVPAARHYRKYQLLNSNSFTGGQGAQADRNTWRKEVDAMKGWIAERLEWMDGAPQTTSTTVLTPRLKPTELINATSGLPQFGGNVPVGYEFKIENPNSAGGTVYYSIDGADPRQTGGTLNPAALTATAKTVTASTLMTNAQTWKWLLPTAAPANDTNGAAWTAEAFLDSAWTSGAAPLGYYKPGTTTGLTTVIATPAPTYANALIAAGTGEPGAAYFRTTFTATGTANLTSAQFDIQADDGAVIYLNGVEVARFNYPLAPTVPAFGTEALGPIDNGNNYVPIESTFFNVPFDKTKLKDGVNTLAVEVHQANYSFPPNPANAYPRNDFSDLRFELKLTGFTASAAGPAYTLATSGTHVVRTRIQNGSVWSPLTEAVFVVGGTAPVAGELVVSQLHYHPTDPTLAELALGYNKENDFEFIELMNISNHPLDLSAVSFEGAVTYSFAGASPAARYLVPGARVVVVENSAAFTSRLAVGATPLVAGAYGGNFSNDTEEIIIKNGASELFKFTYFDSKPWPKQADGNGPCLVLNLPFTNPDHGNPLNWRPSYISNGSPGAADAPAFTGSWNADSDNDGYTDGITYATGLTASGAPPVTQATEPRTIEPSLTPEDYLIIRCVRKLNTDALVQPEWCDDLSSWTTNGLVYEGVDTNPANTPAGTAILIFRSAVPISPTTTRKFMRPKVTGY
jgi:hypothetical protein